VWIRLEGRGLILESSLEMARKPGITSVAESAETQDDWNLLRECGCDLAQDFSSPGPWKPLFPLTGYANGMNERMP
jgi:EAL domain-containing protein (putative c-di-GMP-specific phosphodiesterase class I)